MQTQVAYQKRREAKSRQIKELSKQFSTRNVEEVESVETADYSKEHSPIQTLERYA
jgi:hypothetical protein